MHITDPYDSGETAHKAVVFRSHAMLACLIHDTMLQYRRL